MNKTKVVAKPVTKSQKVRDLLAQGKTIAECRDLVGIDYGFAYGIAQRAGLAQTAAKRRPEANSKAIDLVQAAQPKWTRARCAKFVETYMASKVA